MAVLASPLMPGKAETLWGVLGQPGEAAKADWASLRAPPVTGASTRKPDGLSPTPGTNRNQFTDNKLSCYHGT